MLSRWNAPARKVAVALPPREGARLVVACCLHNRSFRLLRALCRAVRPDALACLGDLSGVGGPLEAAELAWSWRMDDVPTLFVPGNHDSEVTARVLLDKGAVVLASPQLVSIPLAGGGALHAWGYPDPNHSPMGGPPYDAKLVGAQARQDRHRPPAGVGPYLAAVHNARQVAGGPPELRLVLSGHAHVPKVWREGDRTYARCGTSGGGGVGYHGFRQFLVIDVGLPGHEARSIWTVEVDGGTREVEMDREV